MVKNEKTISKPKGKTEPQELSAAPAQRYHAQPIEEKWFARWQQDASLFAAEQASQRKKYYVLEMLPYPSGALHMGHVRNYCIGDALARHMWMRGYNVLHPMGWDAFGLPAENAALENKVPPKEWTLKNIAFMKAQMKRLGFSYDWSTEVTTCLPEYYRWNQWFFLQLYQRGLAYRKKSKVNWCPKCATVLANEQVVEGCCWRHEETPVEQRELEQWFLRITRYADELLADLEKLEHWPEKVRVMQRNWIGRSEGATVDFKLEGKAGPAGDTIRVFTTRIDTILGATSIQLAPEHPLVADLVSASPQLKAEADAMIAEQRRARDAGGEAAAVEKRGVFTGRYALNPFLPAAEEEIQKKGKRQRAPAAAGSKSDAQLPIWIANYIVMEYGTGAIMSVPAHDERDYEFAKKYNLEIRVVVLPRRKEEPPESGRRDSDVLPYTGRDSLLINSGRFNGLSVEEAIEKMTGYAEERGFGRRAITYRLKDWGISRQRYWGTPIPILYCDKCGVVPVPEKDLPVLLPENVKITLQGGSPLAKVKSFLNAPCPKCGGKARRETDTMDTFVDSSWYFYRYTSPRAHQAPFDSAAAGYWFPIDQYIGGVEHAILHLIYSRFWTKMMRDLGLVRHSEPIARLFTQGMVIKEGAKMSKSRGNVVSPDEMIARYGADSARLYSLFAAPPDRDLDWNDAGVEGIHRFLSRVYRMVARDGRAAAPPAAPKASGDGSQLSAAARRIQRKLHQTIQRVTDDFNGRWHFNTSIAAIMELVNELQDAQPEIARGALPRPLLDQTYRGLVLLLAPFAPYLACELWETLGEKSSLLHQSWPQYDAALAREEEVEIAVQVNGKVRSRILLPADSPDEAVKQRALADEKIRASLEGKELLRAIVVPGKLVNLVVK